MPDTTQPLIAVDVVPLQFTSTDGLKIGTAVRRTEPYAGRSALPGVLLAGGEQLAVAALRAAETKAGIQPGNIRCLHQIGAFDQKGRDPREHAISIAFLAVIPTSPGIVWRPVARRATGLPFDHDTIVEAALEQARNRLWTDTRFTRALLGEKFTTSAAAQLTADLTGVKPHAGNFHRSLSNNAALTRVGNAAFAGSGRPPGLWRWLEDTN